MAETIMPQGLQAGQSKTRWVEQIEQHFAAGEYVSAQEAAAAALQELPGDREVQGLALLAEEGVRRSAEAGLLLDRARANVAGGNSEEALAQLRDAERLDERSAAVRAALVEALVERARALLASDRGAAEPLVREALELDRGNPLVRSLASLIEKYREQGLSPSADEPEVPEPQEPVMAPVIGAEAPGPEDAPLKPALEVVGTPPKPKLKLAIFGGAVALAIIVAVAAFFVFRRSTPRTPKPAPALVAASPAKTAPSRPPAQAPPRLQPQPPNPAAPVAAIPKRIPLTVSANVPDAVVLIDGTPLKTPMRNGSRILPLLPGKFRIRVEHKGYKPSAEQTVEIKAGEEPRPLAFTLTPLVHYATLSITGAPAQTEVWIDAERVGEIGDSGKFTQQVPAGAHQISLRKPNFEQVSITQDFKPNQVVRLDGDGVRPYGTVQVHVTPASAKVTYLREGETESRTAPANQAIALPQGMYRITAEADQYISKSASVKVAPGAAVSLDWTLKAAANPNAAVTPASTFETSLAWAVKGGWWIHDAAGYSFLRRRQGTFEIDILKEMQKGFLHSGPKKVNFAADYVNEDNRIAYTLDGHFLTRRVFAKGHAQREVRVPLGMDASRLYRMVAEIAAHSVSIKTVAGKELDTVKTSGPMGKFGFRGEVKLVVR